MRHAPSLDARRGRRLRGGAASSSAGTLHTLTGNGSPLTLTSLTIKGIQYAFFRATDGQLVAHYG